MFAEYYDESIKELVDTPELHQTVVNIRNMKPQELLKLSADLKTECAIDPKFEQTKTCRVSAKTAMRAMQEYENNGYKEPVTIGGVLMAIIGGIITGEIISGFFNSKS